MYPTGPTGFTDEDGYFWTVDSTTLIVYQWSAEVEVFETTDCSGPSYFPLGTSGNRTPRLVWRRSYDPTPLNPTFFVFPDAVSAVAITMRSLRSYTGCQLTSGSGPVYAWADAIVVERPVLTGYLTPIHAQRAP